MAIHNQINSLMGVYDPYNDAYRQLEERAKYEYMRAQQNQHLGLANAVGIQQAQPLPTPEPNKVLLLLE